MSLEISKYRHLVEEYCRGVGLDLGSGGEPVVPWAFQVDVKTDVGVNYVHDARDLPFEKGTFDWVCSSHLLEDFKEWNEILSHWVSLLKPGGYLIVIVPDKKLFRGAVKGGQTDNLSHQRESFPGEVSSVAEKLSMETLRDSLTQQHPGDYSILYVGRKP